MPGADAFFLYSCSYAECNYARLGFLGQVYNWLVVSTHLKNISQIGNIPQIEVKIKIFETTTQIICELFSITLRHHITWLITIRDMYNFYNPTIFSHVFLMRHQCHLGPCLAFASSTLGKSKQVFSQMVV